jgi:hypothetical protein
VRPVEAKPLLVSRSKHRSPVFALRQKNFRGWQAEVRPQHSAQWRPSTLWTVAHTPHVNLVIAQTLCYVGKCLNWRLDHPCMVPLAVAVHKRGV